MKKQIFLLSLFTILLIVLLVLLFEHLHWLFLFGLGGIVTGNILGNISGKIGNIVGSKWKNLKTVREYCIPSNPNTSDQIFSRDNFAVISQFASWINIPILIPFWSYKSSKMSGYNRFIKLNSGIENFILNLDKVIMCQGNLFNGVPLDGICTTEDCGCNIYVSTALGHNGLETDKLAIIFFRPTSSSFLFSIGEYTRIRSTIHFDLPDIFLGEVVFAWVFYFRNEENGKLITSVSTSKKFITTQY